MEKEKIYIYVTDMWGRTRGRWVISISSSLLPIFSPSRENWILVGTRRKVPSPTIFSPLFPSQPNTHITHFSPIFSPPFSIHLVFTQTKWTVNEIQIDNEDGSVLKKEITWRWRGEKIEINNRTTKTHTTFANSPYGELNDEKNIKNETNWLSNVDVLKDLRGWLLH